MDFLRVNIIHLSIFFASLSVVGYLAVQLWLSCKKWQSSESKNNTPIPFLHSTRVGAFVITAILLSITILWPTSPWGNEDVREWSEIVWLLDVSRSMDVRDIRSGEQNTSRLERAKGLMSEFMSEHPENRYGLLIFAGQPRIVSPLTTSTDSILTFLSSLDSTSISEGGSDFQKAIGLAMERFSATGSTVTSRSFFLLSDGGDDEDMPDETSLRNLFHTQHIHLSTIGLGSEQGGPIPIGTDITGNTLYKKQWGETVLSAISEKNLRLLARIGGGKYLSGNDNSADLSDLVKDLSKQVIRSNEYQNEQDIGRWLVLMAIPFFLLSIIPPRKKKI